MEKLYFLILKKKWVKYQGLFDITNLILRLRYFSIFGRKLHCIYVYHYFHGTIFYFIFFLPYLAIFCYWTVAHCPHFILSILHLFSFIDSEVICYSNSKHFLSIYVQDNIYAIIFLHRYFSLVKINSIFLTCLFFHCSIKFLEKKIN